MQFRFSRRRATALALGLALGVVPAASAQTMNQMGKLKVGDEAPAFPNPLPSTAGESAGALALDLSRVLGEKNIVLAFYVADWTGT